MNRCPYCGSGELIYDLKRGVVFCAKCGRDIEEHIIDLGPDWRPLDRFNRPLARASLISISLPGYGLGIGEIRGVQRIKPYMLLESAERNIAQMRMFLKQIITNMNMPQSLIDEVIARYRRLIKMGYRGKVKPTALALLYITCRARGIPCLIKDLLKGVDIDVKEFNRAYMAVAMHIKAKGIYGDGDLTAIATRIMDNLKIQGDVRKAIYDELMEFIKASKSDGVFSGKSPASVMAAIIYILLTIYNVKVKQRDVAQASGVTDVTIRNRVGELAKSLSIRVIV